MSFHWLCGSTYPSWSRHGLVFSSRKKWWPSPGQRRGKLIEPCLKVSNNSSISINHSDGFHSGPTSRGTESACSLLCQILASSIWKNQINETSRSLVDFELRSGPKDAFHGRNYHVNMNKWTERSKNLKLRSIGKCEKDLNHVCLKCLWTTAHYLKRDIGLDYRKIL